MSVVYVLAHFDDEYCALPLIRRGVAEGREQRFVHVADYRDPQAGERRRRETLAFLAAQGIAPQMHLHLGAGTGWWDGELRRHAAQAWAALDAAVPGPVARVVVPAWEGGHPDHDVCAALGVKLAAGRGGAQVDQFGLYQGQAMPWILYRAATPLAQNGPVREIPLSLGERLSWLASVRAFPSQAKVWSGLVPALAMTVIGRPAFLYQSLDPRRIGERPHAGPLHYERMFKTPYEAVRRAVDSLASDGPAPWSPVSRAGPA